MTDFIMPETNEKNIKRYLYAEMNEAEKNEFEREMFADDDFFYEVLDTENRLIDRYAAENLTDAELAKFERSLNVFPERRKKIANALALQTYIAEETVATAESISPETEKIGFWRKLSDLFTIKTPLLGSAMAGLIILLSIGSVFLLLENRRKADELAVLQNEKRDLENVRQKREDDLENQFSNANQSIGDLKNQIAGKIEETDALIKTSAEDQQKIRRLEIEREKLLRETNSNAAPPAPPAGPTIASIVLKPGRDKSGGANLETATVGTNTKKIAVSLTLPDQIEKDARVVISINGKMFRENVLPSVSSENNKIINLVLPTDDLPAGANVLTVSDAQGKEIMKYAFNVDKNQ